jgi:hypothetical protein
MHPTRIFKTPEELKQAWEDYKADLDKEAKKWAKVQYVGKDGIRVEDYPPMPRDLDGFYAWYLDKYGKHIHQYFDNLKKVEDVYGSEFLGIVTHIKADRNANIKTGTLLGFYNSAMGNRIVGLADTVQNNITVEQPLFNDVPKNDSDKQDTSS